MVNEESEQAKRKARWDFHVQSLLMVAVFLCRSERFGKDAKGTEDLDEETARKLERAQR